MRTFYSLFALLTINPVFCQFIVPGQSQTNVTITEKRDFYSQYRDIANANANNAIAQAQMAEVNAMQAKLRAEYESKAVSNPSLDLNSAYKSSKNRNYCSGRRKITVWVPSTWSLQERPDIDPWVENEYPILAAGRVYEDNTKIVMHLGTICNITESIFNEQNTDDQSRLSKGILGLNFDDQNVIQFIEPFSAAYNADLRIGDKIIEGFNLTTDTLWGRELGNPGDEVALKLSRGGEEIVKNVILQKRTSVSGKLNVDGMNGYFVAESHYFERFGDTQHAISVKNIFFDDSRNLNWVIYFEIVAPDDGATFEYNWKRFRPVVAALVENFDVQ